MYISLFTGKIPVNYTSEFRVLFEATVDYQGDICLIVPWYRYSICDQLISG